MICRYSTEYEIPSSLCDASGKLGLPQCVGMLVDYANIHLNQFSAGRSKVKERGLVWIITKSALRIFRMPNVYETVTITTWPDKFRYVCMNRYYKISVGDEVLLYGKMEFALMDFVKRTVVREDSIFPEDTEYWDFKPEEPDFTRIAPKFECDPFATHTVKCSDIDINAHMNNARYITALLDTFTTAELAEKPITALEIHYKAESKEGDVLEVRRRTAADGAEEYSMSVEDAVKTLIKIRR